MTQLAGLVLLVFLIAFGLYATGARAVVSALPFELALITGMAGATLLIGNSPGVAREAVSGFTRAFAGSHWNREAYRQLLALLYELSQRVRQGGHIAVEREIEAPAESRLFAQAPAVLADVAMRDLICDAFRLMAIDLNDARRANAQMEQFIQTRISARMRAVSALHTLADALPALGIIAAVLGIIKTMTAIDQSTAVIGAMIASALLGTFLGVFLAYGLVGPIALRYGQIIEDEAAALETARDFISAFSTGAPARVALEIAMAGIPAGERPDADALEHQLQALRFANASRSAA